MPRPPQDSFDHLVLIIDLRRRGAVLLDRVQVELGPKAWDVLYQMALKPQEVLSNSKLFNLAWTGPRKPEHAQLHTQLSTIRTRFEATRPRRGELIVTVPAIGVMLNVPYDNIAILPQSIPERETKSPIPEMQNAM